MLPNRNLSPLARKLWIVVLALSPAACLAGVWLFSQGLQKQGLRFEVNRAQALQRVAGLAASKGVGLEGWTGYVQPSGNDTMHAYRRMPRDYPEGLLRLSPDIEIQAGFAGRDKNGDLQTFHADLGPEGQVLGFNLDLEDGQYGPDAGEDEARQLAQSAFDGILKDSGIVMEGPEVDSDRKGDSVVRSFQWEGAHPRFPELEFEFRADVRGSQLTRVDLDTDLEEDFVDERLDLQPLPVLLLGIAAFISVFCISIYCFIRFVRRNQQKEIPRKGILAIGGFFGTGYALIAVHAIWDALAPTDLHPLLFWVVVASVFLMLGMAGLCIGAAWAATEGDLREASPGKLTSLDALIAGKLFSRNVSRSMVVGAALGGWLLLAFTSISLLWQDHLAAGFSVERAASLAYARFPVLFTLISPLADTIPPIVAGLLAPLSLAYRRFSSPGRRKAVFLVAAFLGCSLIGADVYYYIAWILVTVLIFATLLLLYFTFDLLTAVVGLSFLSFLVSATTVATITTGQSTQVGLLSGLVAIGLSVQLYFAFKGRIYTDREVRPVYARHMAHRQSMQAEVSAARQAQLRLAPQGIPSIPGLSVAADCRPARVVGGDFYDFFPMSERSLGILLAEGGGKGLSSALSIAFAKGVILPLAARGRSPDDIFSRLLPALRPLLDEESRIGLLYAVADLDAGILSWTRLGSYPRLLACGDEPDGRMAPPETQEGSRSLQIDGRSFEIFSSSLTLRPGDRLVLFTDGVAEALSAVDSATSPERWILDFLSSRREDSAQEVQKALFKALAPKIKKARKRGIEDDVSAILLQIDRETQAAPAPQSAAEVQVEVA